MPNNNNYQQDKTNSGNFQSRKQSFEQELRTWAEQKGFQIQNMDITENQATIKWNYSGNQPVGSDMTSQ